MKILDKIRKNHVGTKLVIGRRRFHKDTTYLHLEFTDDVIDVLPGFLNWVEEEMGKSKKEKES